jgi:hypothetical protein
MLGNGNTKITPSVGEAEGLEPLNSKCRLFEDELDGAGVYVPAQVAYTGRSHGGGGGLTATQTAAERLGGTNIRVSDRGDLVADWPQGYFEDPAFTFA